MAFNNPIAAGDGGALVRDSIKSPDYVPGTSGWIIRRDGTAEFRNVIVQGTIVLTPGQVTNTEIADGAVTNSKITDVVVDKVTTGTTQFDWTVGARIKTADSGTRVELSPDGIQAFNGSVQTVDISSTTGDISILGQLLSGNSGLRLVVNPTGETTPQIRWYPNAGSNYSVIRSSGTLFTDEATMVMTSGINSGNTASARYLIAAGFIGGEINDETGLLDNGGSWDIAESYIAMRYTHISGSGGALLYGDSGRVLLGMVSDQDLQTSKGGMLRVENSFVRLRMESSSNTNNGGFIYQDGSVAQYGWQQGSDYTMWEMDSSRFTDHYGQWHDFADLGSNQGIFGATVVMTSGAASGSWSYGSTKEGQIVPIAVTRDNVAHADTISGSNTSGGTMEISPAGSGAWSVYLWGFQI